MQIKLYWIENKNKDWKVASVISPDGTKTDNVSLNRTDKQGNTFPNFDSLSAGSTIDCEMWKSQSGKWYISPLKSSPRGNSGANRGGFGAKAMEQKAQTIQRAQENKEEGIKTSSTIRMATDVVVALTAIGNTNSLVKSEILHWREWFIDNWDLPKGDFPSEPPF